MIQRGMAQMSQLNQQEGLPANAGGLHKFAFKFDKIVKKINSVLHMFSCIILFALMFLTLADVIGRFAFNSPIKGTMELTKMAVAVMVFFSIGIAQLKGDHLEIDFIVNKFSPRALGFYKFIVYLVVSIVLFILSWRLFVLGIDAQRANELSGDLAIPLFYVMYPVAVASIGFALSYLASAFNNLSKAVMK